MLGSRLQLSFPRQLRDIEGRLANILKIAVVIRRVAVF